MPSQGFAEKHCHFTIKSWTIMLTYNEVTLLIVLQRNTVILHLLPESLSSNQHNYLPDSLGVAKEQHAIKFQPQESRQLCNPFFPLSILWIRFSQNNYALFEVMKKV